MCFASVTFFSLRNLEVPHEEAMQLRMLVKSSNESIGPYMFGKFELKFRHSEKATKLKKIFHLKFDITQ